MSPSRPVRRLLTTGVGVGATVAACVVGVPAAATAAPALPAAPGVPPAASAQVRPYDARTGADATQAGALATTRAQAQASPGVQATRAELGAQAVVDVDALTGTPRQVARLDGFLTGASTASPESVARAYVQGHPDLFHLTAAEVGALTLARDYADVAGTHHLSFTQSAGGLTLFGNGLKADVTKAGQLVQVTGAPLPGLTAQAKVANPVVGSADAAIRVAKRDTAEADVAPGKRDSAQAVLFRTPGGTRTAWRTVTMSAATPTLDVVDAASGRILYRDPLADDWAEPTAPAAPNAKAPTQYANVVDNFPGAAAGGTLQKVDLNQNGWLPRGSVVLYGNNSHTYADVNDNDAADQTEEISPSATSTYRFPLTRFTPSGEPCGGAYACTWNPDKAGSWQANLARTATQNFYFINKYHDHLAADPIGFTEAAGNFQQVNSSGSGLGGDPVQDQPLDGANTANGLPDANHIDNANFATPPDGTAPTMQMYLFHQPGPAFPDEDPFLATSGSDEADIVYHEYTHGLSHRLVVDADNVPALDSFQGGSMGEAWSDWYAMDYLTNDGYVTDSSKVGDVLVGQYVTNGSTIRTEPLDCPVGGPKAVCPGTPGAGPGGYTYGDMGRISSRGPEVHADGEIWAQTLWDVRTALGSAVTESIVTRGMELSPTFPSMLDMRNAILLADETVFGGAHQGQLWKLFAARGMGFFAGTVTGDDTSPVEDFSTPPAAGAPRGTLSGVVRDSQSGKPVANVRVAFGGHDSGLPGANYAATSGANGRYTIPNVVVGTYPDVFAIGAGYDLKVVKALSVSASGTTRNWSLVRDWAASSGGGRVAAFDGDDLSAYGCGPGAEIDQSLGTGWGSTSDLSASGAPTAATPKSITIALPRAVDLSGISVDPSNTCGDDPTAATGEYRMEVSTDGTTFTTVATGTFTPADLGGLRPITLSGAVAGVTAVRFTMVSPQAVTQGIACPGSGASGCLYLDSTEVEVYGSPAAA